MTALKLALVFAVVAKKAHNAIHNVLFRYGRVVRDADVDLPKPLLSWDEVSGALESPNRTPGGVGFPVANEYGIAQGPAPETGLKAPRAQLRDQPLMLGRGVFHRRIT